MTLALTYLIITALSFFAIDSKNNGQLLTKKRVKKSVGLALVWPGSLPYLSVKRIVEWWRELPDG